MSLILCIETGTDVCSVGLAKNGELISLRESDTGRDHARNVAVYTDEILRQTDTDPAELDAVAVGAGPGSYTGLRIGVSFAKGMCYALGIPLLAIDSLRSLAEVALEDHRAGIVDIEEEQWDEALLCPMIDARRMEVYTEVFDTRLQSLTPVHAEVLTGDSFSGFVGGGRQLVIFGNGAAKARDVLPRQGVRHIDVVPSARGLCRAAQEKLNKGIMEDVAYFEPFYLKDFVVTASKKKFF